MKNFINYFYDFNIYDIYFNNGKYFFYNEQIKYMFKVCENINMLPSYLEINQQLMSHQYFFTVIPNKDNDYITWIENKPYILLKLSNIENDKISIFDIRTDIYVDVSDNVSLLSHFPWAKLWEVKIDYFEELFTGKHSSYKNIYPLFHYFIGIAENALLYLKESEKEEKIEEVDRLVVSHDRLNLNYELYDYYDPTNIIIDHASRGISEYLKSAFVNKVWDFDLFCDYLKEHYFSKYGLRIMLARIIFPSFFFDYIENMLIKNKEIDLLYLEARADDFQNFVKQISLFLKEEYDIPVIPWIIKKT